MTKTFRNLLFDIAWLLMAFALTLLLCKVFLPWDTDSNTIDFHFHDTYLVIAAWHLIIPLFVLLSFVIFFIKGALKGFTCTGSNIILIISGILSIISIGVVNKWLAAMGTVLDFTLYPPLSGFEDEQSPIINPVIFFVTNVLLVLQIVITVLLLVVAFMWGRDRRVKQ